MSVHLAANKMPPAESNDISKSYVLMPNHPCIDYESRFDKKPPRVNDLKQQTNLFLRSDNGTLCIIGLMLRKTSRCFDTGDSDSFALLTMRSVK